MNHFLLVAMGGAVGASLRHLANLLALRWTGPGFPWGTMFVNIAGSLAMGLFVGWLARRAGGSSNELRLLVATGFLGGFTTFSAFSLDVATLWERGAVVPAFAYVLASVVLAISALFAGLWLTRMLP
ncbi:MAG: fluoride efflux transporter CrcB [Pseudomonadota bacterium]|nr:fluoride efflux transporter CrcB [Pseudomonadota bacterium]